jgi:hypothetical protein
VRVDGESTAVVLPLDDDVASRAFDESGSLNGIDGMPAQLPRGNIHNAITIIVLLLHFRIGQLVDVIPKRILTAGNGVPPSFQPFPVLYEILLVVLQLEGQVIAQVGLLLV